MQAATWLASTSALSKQEGILINQNWNANFDEQVENSDAELVSNAQIHRTADDANSLSEDDFSEDEAETTAGVTDIMITATDSLDDSERQEIYNIAPGEGNRPLSVFQDQYSEELAYPGIFLGQTRPQETNE